jgi:hypothetical protein
MKKIDLGQTITILANVGVIAGLFFLALELQQNNRFLESSAREARNARVQGLAEQIYMVPGLAEIFVKTRNSEPLTEAEELKLFGFNLRRIRGFEAYYQEFSEGVVPEPPVQAWKNAFEGAPHNIPMDEDWEESKLLMGNQEFIEWFEEHVIPR